MQEKMLRSVESVYPSVLLAKSLVDRDQMGLRDIYYKAKGINRQNGPSIYDASYTDEAKIDAAVEVCANLVKDDYVSKLTRAIMSSIHSSHNDAARLPTNVKLVFPVATAADQSGNVLSVCFAAFLEEKLRASMRHEKVHIECDFDIYCLTKLQRSKSSPQNTLEQVKVAKVQQLAKQPLFGGKIDRAAVYVVVDDSVYHQTTFANLVSYLRGQGAIIAAVTTLVGPTASCHMQAKNESLVFLENILDKRRVRWKQIGGVFSDTKIFKDLGLSISQTGTTLTNIEVLTMAAYFGDTRDSKTMENVLVNLGSVRGTDELRLMQLVQASPGCIEELHSILSFAGTNEPHRGDSSWVNSVYKLGGIRVAQG